MPTFKNIHVQFIEFIKNTRLVIFNAPFDLKFLNAELNRINYLSTVSDICAEVTCAMELAKNMPKLTPVVNTSTVDNDTGFVFVLNVNFDFTQ